MVGLWLATTAAAKLKNCATGDAQGVKYTVFWLIS